MVRKLLITVLFMLALSGSLAGQRHGATVTGTVTDVSGVPMAGATVMISGAGTGVAAGNDGRYTLRGLRDGTHTVRISFTGYEPVDTTVTVHGNAVLDVTLREALYIAGEVIVRGSRAGPAERPYVPCARQAALPFTVRNASADKSVAGTPSC